jgi:hypothetical protein
MSISWLLGITRASFTDFPSLCLQSPAKSPATQPFQRPKASNTSRIATRNYDGAPRSSAGSRATPVVTSRESSRTDKAAAAAIRHVLAKDFEVLKKQVAQASQASGSPVKAGTSTTAAAAAAAAGRAGVPAGTDRAALEKDLATLEQEFALLGYLNAQ